MKFTLRFLCLFGVLALCPILGYSQLSGSYTIGGSSANYSSITAAISALTSSGVNGPVVFTINAGTYNEDIYITRAISGASSTNRITFRGVGKHRVIIRDNYPVYLYNCDFIAVENVTLEARSYYAIYWYYADYNKVENCIVKVNTSSTSSSYRACYVRYSNNDTLRDNRIEGGYYGLYYYGSSTSFSNNYGHIIEGNDIVKTYYYGMYQRYGRDNKVLANRMDSFRNNGRVLFMYNYRCSGATIERNRILYNNQYDIGIYLYYANYYGSSSARTRVVNNFIGGNVSSYMYGIYVSTNCRRVDVLHNTVLSNGTSSSGACLYITSGYDHNVQNNNFYQANTSGSYAVYLSSTSYIDSFDYNNIHSENSSRYAYFSGSRSNLSALKSYSSSFNQKCVDESITYTDLRDFKNETIALDNKGNRWVGVTNDILGNKRPVKPDTLIDIGCMDYTLPPNDAGISRFASAQYCPGTARPQVYLKNFGTKDLTSCTVNWAISVNGGSYTTQSSVSFSGKLVPGGDSLMNLGSFTMAKGNTYALKAWTSSPNSTTDIKTGNDTSMVIRRPALRGTFTVGGSGADYSTLDSALLALRQNNVCGPVTLRLANQNFKGQVVIREIPGASATNRIRIVGKGTTIISHSASSTSNWATVLLDGADYITFDSLTIKASGTGYGATVWFTNSADGNIVSNCNLIGDISSTSSNRSNVVFSANSTGYSYGSSGSNNTLLNNNIRGGYWGIAMYGSNSSTFSEYTAGNTIKNNGLYKQYYYGIYAYRTKEKHIEGNDLDSFRYTNAYGIYNYYCGRDHIIANRIRAPYLGIYQRYANYNSVGATTSDTTFIMNNMISGQNGYCIYSYYGYRTMFYNNSFYALSNSSYGCYFRYDYYSQWKNNSFMGLGNYAVYWYSMSLIASGAIDYNNYYTPNSSYLAYASGSHSSISSLQSSTNGNAKSITVDPEYLSDKDLHSLSVNLNNKGTKINYVKTDFDGDKRPYSPDTLYDIGADEFNLPPYDLDITAVYPTVFAQGGNKIRLKLRNNGINDIVQDTAYMEYSINGSTPVKDTFIIKGTLSYGSDTTFEFAVPHTVSGTSGITLCADMDKSIKGDPDKTEKMCLNACVGAAGTYTIKPNGKGDFKTIKDAIGFLSGCGVGGKVVFKMDSAVYQERVLIPEISGASAANTITFDGQDSATIEYRGTSSANAVVLFNGAQHVIFENCTVRNTDNYYSVCFQIMGGTSDIHIRNNTIRPGSSATSSYSGGVIFSSQPNGYIYDGISSNGTRCYIEGNNFNGGSIGVSLRGGNTSDYISDNYILNNTIKNAYNYGVYAYYAENIVVEGNNISDFRNSGAYSITYGYSHGGSISANQLYDCGRMAIYMYRINYYRSGTTKVHNNMIYGPFAYSSPYFVYQYYANDVDFYHNTVYNRSSTNYYMIYSRYSYRSNWVNNLIVNNANGSNILPVYIYSGSFDTLDYNNIYSAGNYFVYHNGTYTDMTGWQSGQSSYNRNSISEKPSLASATDPHLTTSKTSPRGYPLGIPTDVDGDSRCLFAPSIGADESGFSVPNLSANFAVADTVYVNSPTRLINATPKTTPGAHEWYVNDSLKSTEHSLTHIFRNTGYDTVKLVSTGCSGTDSVTKRVFIAAPTKVPVTNFVALDNRIDPYEEVQLFDLSSNGPTQWEWEITPKTVYSPLLGYWSTSYSYENGTDSASQNPSLLFYESGKYTVRLTAKNGIGKGNTETKVAYIEVSAIAQMCNYYPTSTNFSSGTFYDDGGPSGNYSDNKNGTSLCTYLIDPCAKDVTLTFSSFDVRSGSYADYLRIYDGEDNTGTPLWDVSVSSKGLNGTLANIDTSYTAKSGKMYLEFESDYRYNNAGWEARWTSTPGNFAAPVARFSVPDTVCNNSWFFMEIDTGTNVYTNYNVRFGSASSYPVKGGHMVKYQTKGKETLRLVVDNCGGIDSTSKTVTVISPSAAPVPDFEADITRPTTSDVVTLTDKSYRCVDEVRWSFSPSTVEFVNNTDSASLMPEVQFKAKGCYAVTLIAGKNGKYDTLTRNCYIDVIGYCYPAVDNLISDIGISRVTLGQIDNSSEVAEEIYTDYTARHKTSVEVGGSYTVGVERKVALNSMNRAVWIDWNQDGDFNDSLELIGRERSNKTLKWTKTFTVPNTNVARLGATRMRIGTNIGNLSNKPCGPNSYGEFEDYRIVVTRDVTFPTANLIGPDTMTLEQCHSFSDPGISASDNVTIFSNLVITVDNKVNESKVGTYEIIYHVEDEAGNTTSIKRVIMVTPDKTEPAMTILGSAVYHHPVLTTYADSGATAFDLCDGNVSVSVSSSVDANTTGVYEVKYTSTDNANNTVSKTRTVIVEDKVAPTISIKGADTVYVEVNHGFTDPGYNGADNYDPNPVVKVTGNVNTEKLGFYELTYHIEDASGNTGLQATRIVEVGDSTKPTLELNGYATETLEVFSRFIDLGAVVKDNYWDIDDIDYEVAGSFYRNFKNGIASVLGTYTVVYSATDGSDNADSIVRVIEVVDTEAPVIVIDNILRICRWEEVNLLDGVTLQDNYYDATEITVSIDASDLDIHHDGFYQVKYSAEDGSGNKSKPEVRMVIVEHCNVGVVNPVDDGITIYPNPTTGFITVQLDFERKVNTTITITNLQGKLIDEVRMSDVNHTRLERDLSTYGAGIYLISIRTEDRTIVQRIEVIR